jgi:hypothetical protein
MMFTSYDIAYYGVLLALLAVYALSFRPAYAGGISSFFFFRNASVVYFCVFSVLLGKFVYEGTALVSADFSLHLYYLMFYYAIAILMIATMFNLAPQSNLKLSRIPLNVVPLILAVSVKVGLLAIDMTPMQVLLSEGIIEAHIKQIEWHEPGAGGAVKLFYVYFGAALCILFLVYFHRTRSRLFKVALFFLLIETSGFYLSKSGMIIPLIVLLSLSGIKLRYLGFIGVAGIFAVFYIRLGVVTDLDMEQFLAEIGDRLVQETGYANTHLELYEREHPPLGFESRYFLGLNTLFGLEPIVDASRKAYMLETGRLGGTTSGHAAVSLYAFWGLAFYAVAPILICFVFFVDKGLVNSLRTDYGLLGYLFITFKSVNYLTVDIQRLISFQTVVDVTFFLSVVIVVGLGKVLRFSAFSKRISIIGVRYAQRA